jgi:hypothetical protein
MDGAPDLAALPVAAAGVFLIAFMKGAFGGGFAIVGIPLLSLVMDPISAGALLAPLFIAMDVVAFRYWRPSTWSRPDLLMLVPALVVGTAVGYALLSRLDLHAIEIGVALVTLGFAALWLTGGAQVETRPRSLPKALAFGFGAGITTMVAHSGGPPLAMYLLPLGTSCRSACRRRSTPAPPARSSASPTPSRRARGSCSAGRRARSGPSPRCVCRWCRSASGSAGACTRGSTSCSSIAPATASWSSPP